MDEKEIYRRQNDVNFKPCSPALSLARSAPLRSLLVARCSLLVARCSLLVARCSLLVASLLIISLLFVLQVFDSSVIESLEPSESM